MTLDMQAARSRAEAATPGPWFIGQAGFDRARRMIGARLGNMDVGFLAEQEISRDPEANAKFIAHARTDLPAALDIIDAVLALHRGDDHFPYRCSFDGQVWPCLTAQAAGVPSGSSETAPQSQVVEPVEPKA